jgi:hypothetical protein
VQSGVEAFDALGVGVEFLEVETARQQVGMRLGDARDLTTKARFLSPNFGLSAQSLKLRSIREGRASASAARAALARSGCSSVNGASMRFTDMVRSSVSTDQAVC